MLNLHLRSLICRVCLFNVQNVKSPGNINQILTGFCRQYWKILARGQKYGPSASEVHAFDQGPIFSSIAQSNQLILVLLPVDVCNCTEKTKLFKYTILLIEISFNNKVTLHVVSIVFEFYRFFDTNILRSNFIFKLY